MHFAARALLALYREPHDASRLAAADWSSVLGAMRRARCMGPMGVRLRQAEMMASVPDAVQGQFDTSLVVAKDRRHLLRWELLELSRALAPLNEPVLVLKGAAYELQYLSLAAGRTPGDVDLLVRRETLASAEKLLRDAGWISEQLDSYDERYYRDWSHEIAPMRHPERRLEVDLHHAVTPSLRGKGIDTQALFTASRVCGPFRVLDPLDQVIHCAVHTFKDSDLGGRLREVMDFDQLVREFSTENVDGFSARLWARAAELGAVAELTLAVRTARRWLGTPLKNPVLVGLPPGAHLVAFRQANRALASGGLAWRAWDALLDASMLPGARQQPGTGAWLARMLLLTRYHLRRMPLRRLLPHLAEKTRRRWIDRA